MGKLKYALIAILLIGISLLVSSGDALFDGSSTSSTAENSIENPGSGIPSSLVENPPPYVDEEIGSELTTTELVEEVAPAVVSIVTEKITHGMFLQPIPQKGAGTGVIISPEGYIVTNNHVVEDANKITVTLSDGRTFEGVKVASDPQTDLAVVQIEGSGFPYLHLLGNPLEQLNELDPVVAVGNALALPGGPTWTAGVVSNLGRSIQLPNGVVLYDLIQTDAAINPGNSGGPLVNMAGQIVGINVAIAAEAENIGFAISTNTVIPVIKSLIEEGQVVRPWLGVSMLTITPTIKYQYNLSVDKGVLIVEVSNGSPASKAGLKPGDVVTGIGEQEVNTAEEIRLAIQAHQVGDEVEIVYFRGSEQKTTNATLRETPS